MAYLGASAVAAYAAVAISMETVFRLAHKETGTSLPLHWAYSDPWEYDDESEEAQVLVDRREEGAQVWASAGRVIGVAAGVILADGDYPADEYPRILVIDARDVYDSAGEWYAVLPDDVVAVRSVPAKRAIRWARSRSQQEFDGDAEESLREFLEDDEYAEEIADWLRSASVPVKTTWVETLPKPG